MLKSFTVSNYKSFRDEIYFDLSNTRDYEFNNYLITNGILNKSIIYGKNASGKTNFGFALFDIVAHLSDKTHSRNNRFYLNANSKSNIAVFKYNFCFGKTNFVYEYGKTSDIELAYERVFVNDELVFDYDMQNNIELLNRIEWSQDIQWINKDDKTSAIKFIVTTFKLENDNPLQQMYKFVNKMLWFRSMDGKNNYIGYDSIKNSVDEYIYIKKLGGKLERFLNDNGVNEKIIVELQNGEPLIQFKYANHTIPFSSVASSGTKSLLLVFYWMEKAFDDVSLVFLDEFDAFYHVELSAAIVRSIFEERDFQAILTTHNVSLIDNISYRPDIYFYLNNGKIKSFPDSTDRIIRQAHNLEKMFRAGVFNNK